ncbi:adenylate/guanylate cyclase domain-containing protein [Vibrio cyclitrophicus]|uniref:adenylate/guanylate cyclase domain-containing protein n=1 Tax=Vibrio cyclitrophicus TaxID=47951 RepID=UPI000C816E92|nr:adenylate/guanylate cyclase domain-containing protein [Vibrio cyclitrophicus]PMF23794.1 family 3 adenylate cyclase [Vibrio cyclitrophicus]
MKAEYSAYDFAKSRDRIDEILKGADADYKDRDSIPSRDELTFTNGFNVKCSALFVDIRGSKAINAKHTKPVLAKIYKTYISELVAIMKNHPKVSEISIEGDCVWGIFNTPLKTDIDDVFAVAYRISSLIDALNIKLRKRKYSELTVGIGAAWGRSLLIKSGYKGSGINEVVWLGSLVSEAAKLCDYGNKTINDCEIMVSDDFHHNLNDHNKGLLMKNNNRECYHGDVVSGSMNEWVQNNG